MKKAFLITLTALLLTGCGGNTKVHTGTATGYGGDVKVEVKVDKSSKITEIKVDAPDETPTIGGEAAPKVAQSIKEQQSLKVDTVSGATVTSKAVIEAVKNALKEGSITFDGME